MSLKHVLAAGAFTVAIAGCSNENGDAEKAAESAPATPATEEKKDVEASPDPLSRMKKVAADNLAASQAFLAENEGKDGVKKTASGLQYKVLTEGDADGRSPVSTDLVVVHYVGTLRDGTEFDSSVARGAAAQFPLNRVIPGWTEGVQLMKEGDKFRFFVPPELAYGERGGGELIGPNEVLIFDVELFKVKNPEINLAAAREFLDKNAKEEGVTVTQSGLQYKVLTKGKADNNPAATDTVKVHYAGTLLDGTEFDSSYSRGQPIEFPLNRVIDGWTEGVQLMSPGDKFRFFIPPDLGYGAAGTPGGPIGPNEALVFEVELIEIK